ncbi:TetR/AcrR family transcriptional regulator [Halorussus aquaticus]|uniref:TetR/AcrR family transcriptional regulator n=1 Tax=Halorussus aquaticus TaxID=2953748 RepID=A0ABD5PXV6_9EURY|nr:TetR/AcrR family transcriptional regulator [Halorussus aquaticus]
MSALDIFENDSDDTKSAIMRATYHALCEHGYANLTIQRIGDEFAKSKSLLYHHYDSKDELLVDFLEFVLEKFKADIPAEEYDDPCAHLREVLDHVVPPTLDAERYEFTSAMIELRAQAPHDEAYREQFSRNDRFFRQQFADVVRDGVETGAFRDVDPEQAAALLVTTINGSMLERVTTDDAEDAIRATRRELDAYIDSHLLAESGE